MNAKREQFATWEVEENEARIKHDVGIILSTLDSLEREIRDFRNDVSKEDCCYASSFCSNNISRLTEILSLADSICRMKEVNKTIRFLLKE